MFKYRRSAQFTDSCGTTIACRALRFLSMLCIAWLTTATAQADEEVGDGEKTQWAVLIGCQDYQRANKLHFTVNDVEQLATTLHVRGGYGKDHIQQMTDKSPNDNRKPLRTNLLMELPRFLKKVGPQDLLLVYFSGHGFRDPDGKMYLAPLDVDPEKPAETGIPVEWLRQQIAGCQADFKLLILDACHAGSEKGESAVSVPSKDLGQMFGDLDKVVTIASSTADQSSQLWTDRQQSLFSYWLNQGLKGHADTGGDGQVDIDELYKYVETNVRRTGETILGRTQTPVRIIRPGTLGSPVVVSLQPQSLDQTLADISEQLSNAVIEHRLGSVGVPEFANLNPGGETMLGGQFGRYCAEELENRLVDRGVGHYSVVEGKRLNKLLRDRHMGLADLSSSAALKDLAERSGGMPVIVEGTMRNRQGASLTLRCKLVETRGDKTIASVGGVAKLNESEWAMLGHSVVVKPDDRRPVSNRPREDQLIERLDDRAQGPNPMLDPSFPFRVWLVIDGKLRPGVARGNDYLVPVRKGEIMEIWIENRGSGGRAPQIALMRLLVDGLNTKPEKPQKGIAEVPWGQRVNLSEASHWELDPSRGLVPDRRLVQQGIAAQSRVYAVRGFATEVNLQGKMKEFVVVDADKSLAARREFTDQLGVITAAFYAPAGTSRGRLGIAAGREIDERIDKAQGYECGNLLGVVHIRYVDADALQAAGR